jgi:hypothetical protein
MLMHEPKPVRNESTARGARYYTATQISNNGGLKWAWAWLEISEAQARGSSPGFDITVLVRGCLIKMVSSSTKYFRWFSCKF